MYTFSIKLTHFNKFYLNKLVINLVQLLVKLKIGARIKVITLPNKKKQITLLRSPHIFKKSQEQFGHTIYSKVIYIITEVNSLLVIKSCLQKLNCNYKLNLSYE